MAVLQPQKIIHGSFSLVAYALRKQVLRNLINWPANWQPPFAEVMWRRRRVAPLSSIPFKYIVAPGKRRYRKVSDPFCRACRFPMNPFHVRLSETGAYRRYNPSVQAIQRQFLLRWSAALLGIFCGWLFELVVFLPFSDTLSRGFDAAEFISLYFAAAWLLFGLPLAVWGPRLSSAGRIALACIVCGFIGALIPGVLLRSESTQFLRLLLPLPRNYRLWLISFMPAAISMLVYALIVRRYLCDNAR